jgi:hypothetical protein
MAEGRPRKLLETVEREEKLRLWIQVRLDGRDGRKETGRYVRHGQTKSSVIAKVMPVTLSFLMSFLLYLMPRYGLKVLMKSS